MPLPSQPRLADHVRACRVGDQLIFLDLLRSKYIGVGGPQLASLSAALLDGPDAKDALTVSALPDEWIQHLRAKQLLSDAPGDQPLARLPTLIEAAASLDPDDEDRSVPFAWRDLARLWRSTLITAAWVRRRSLADILERVVALRARHAQRTEGIDANAMHAAATSYMRLRPFALTTHDRCLNDSLTLVHFLATQGLFPQWVIGVRVRPFGAHSWVQSEGVVLNDMPERVRRYQPILVA